MYLSLVKPVKEMSLPGQESSKKEQPQKVDSASQVDCGFHTSAVYEILEYPVKFLNICCINVPALCVCGKKFVENELHGNVMAPNNGHIGLDVKVMPCRQDAYQVTPSQARCRNSDGKGLSVLKKLAFAILILFHIVDFVRQCVIMKLSSERLELLIFSMTGFSCLLSQTYLRVFNWFSCSRHFKAFLTSAFLYEKEYGFSGDVASLKRKGKIAFYFGIIQQGLQSLFLASAGMFVFSDALKLQMWPMSNASQTSQHIYYGFYALLAFFLLSVYYGTHFYKIIAIAMLNAEFKSLGNEMAGAVAEINNFPGSERKFDFLLKKFRALSNLSDKSYAVIKHTIAASYIFGVSNICLVLYGMISGAIPFSQYVILSWSAIEAIIVLLHTTVQLSKLQARTRGIADAVQAAEFEDFPQHMLHKATMFTTMFNTRSFGMSVYGMFTVDWSTMLMVGGTLLTYSVVIIQFQLGTPEPVCHCNYE